jgi:uncharacterized repeat protein (TIGR01451 family)
MFKDHKPERGYLARIMAGMASLLVLAMILLPLTASAVNDNADDNAGGNNGNNLSVDPDAPEGNSQGDVDNGKKVTICHATSSETNPYNTLHVSENSTSGHFDENGTQLAGHELDLLINQPDAECPETGSITIIKEVVGGSAPSSDFTMHLTRTSTSTDLTNSPFPGNSTGTSFTSVGKGFLEVSEDTDPNYTASFDGDCDSDGKITLRGGEDKTCTVTNTFTGTVGGASIDLAVDKTVVDSTIVAGSDASYTVTVTNNGPDEATNIVLTDLLPSNLTFVSSVASQGTFTTGTGVWAFTPLASGASATLTIIATVNAGTATGTVITNTASVDATETDTNPANDSDSVDVTVVATTATSIDLAVNKSVNDATLISGSNATYTITVTNNGPDNATGVVLTDVLPGNVNFVSSSTATGSYNDGTGAWTIGALANGASATLTLNVELNTGLSTGTVITNTATVDAVETDSNPANNSDTADITVIKRSSGGGGGSSSGSRGGSTGGQVLGDTTSIPYVAPGQVLGDSTITPSGQVLGDSTLPVTGSSLNYLWAMLATIAMIVMPAAIARKMKDEFASADIK